MTIIDIYSRDMLPLFLPQGGKWEGGKIARFTVLRIDTFFFSLSFLFFSFFFYFYSSSSLRFAIVSDETRAHGTRNDRVKMGKAEVAAMRSVEMIRTVEQVGGRGIEIFAGN